MEIELCFKTPDVVDEALEDVDEKYHDEIRAACKKWVKYDEYIYVVVNTADGSCTVRET